MATATSSRTCPVDYVLFPVPPKLMLSLLLFPMQPAAEAAPPGEQAAGRCALGLEAAMPSGQAVLNCTIVVSNRHGCRD